LFIARIPSNFITLSKRFFESIEEKEKRLLNIADNYRLFEDIKEWLNNDCWSG